MVGFIAQHRREWLLRNWSMAEAYLWAPSLESHHRIVLAQDDVHVLNVTQAAQQCSAAQVQ